MSSTDPIMANQSCQPTLPSRLAALLRPRGGAAAPYRSPTTLRGGA
jgi:hypothetical protein